MTPFNLLRGVPARGILFAKQVKKKERLYRVGREHNTLKNLNSPDGNCEGKKRSKETSYRTLWSVDGG